jgi:hypothetical protein
VTVEAADEKVMDIQKLDPNRRASVLTTLKMVMAQRRAQIQDQVGRWRADGRTVGGREALAELCGRLRRSPSQVMMTTGADQRSPNTRCPNTIRLRCCHGLGERANRPGSGEGRDSPGGPQPRTSAPCCSRSGLFYRSDLYKLHDHHESYSASSSASLVMLKYRSSYPFCASRGNEGREVSVQPARPEPCTRARTLESEMTRM